MFFKCIKVTRGVSPRKTPEERAQLNISCVLGYWATFGTDECLVWEHAIHYFTQYLDTGMYQVLEACEIPPKFAVGDLVAFKGVWAALTKPKYRVVALSVVSKDVYRYLISPTIGATALDATDELVNEQDIRDVIWWKHLAL